MRGKLATRERIEFLLLLERGSLRKKTEQRKEMLSPELLKRSEILSGEECGISGPRP